MPKGVRGGRRNLKPQEDYFMENRVRWSSSRKSESSIEKHFGVKLQGNTLKADEYWTNDIYKHINQGDLSIIKANETIRTGKQYLDSKHNRTVVFFKKYKNFGNVKAVIEVSDEGILLTHTYKVHDKEEKNKRYTHFQ